MVARSYPRGRHVAEFAFRDRAALVTDASSGLGEAFACELAACGMHLFLTALPADETRLSLLAGQLTSDHGVRVERLLIDLTEPGAAGAVQDAADQRAFEPDLLVNNAGMGLLGRFVELSLEQLLTMLKLNTEAPVSLTGLFLPRMVTRGDGAIVNVASTAAFDPLPYMALYAATKAFVVSFSEALWAESHRAGVRVVAFCRGPMSDTQFSTRGESGSGAGPRVAPGLPRAAAVQSALRALERDQPTVVRRVPLLAPAYGLLSFVLHMLPRRVQLLLSERLLRWHFQMA